MHFIQSFESFAFLPVMRRAGACVRLCLCVFKRARARALACAREYVKEKATGFLFFLLNSALGLVWCSSVGVCVYVGVCVCICTHTYTCTH